MTTAAVVTSSAAHIRRADRAGTRRFRKMTETAVQAACQKAIEQGARPVSMVDDLTVHSLGPFWVESFGKCLARSAKRAGISVVGGEMAQMPDTYAKHYVGLWVSVVAIK